jgi:putative transposase
VFAFIDVEKAEFGVSRLCRVLKICRSSYYAWCKRMRSGERSQRAIDDDADTARIIEVFDEHHGRYGSARVRQALLRGGRAIGRRRVRRLMRQNGLRARYKKRFVVTTQAKAEAVVAPNVLKREFTSTAPNQKWVGDVTYLRVPAGFIYLAVLIDLFSRRVVGHAVSTRNDEKLTLAALMMASEQRRPSGCLHHSDRGSTYTSAEYQNALRRGGFTVSMSAKGDCFDNAVAESFFATLKAEVGDEFNGLNDVLHKIPAYIDLYYNTKRLHSTLGYRSPTEYEKMSRHDVVT